MRTSTDILLKAISYGIPLVLFSEEMIYECLKIILQTGNNS